MKKTFIFISVSIIFSSLSIANSMLELLEVFEQADKQNSLNAFNAIDKVAVSDGNKACCVIAEKGRYIHFIVPKIGMEALERNPHVKIGANFVFTPSYAYNDYVFNDVIFKEVTKEGYSKFILFITKNGLEKRLLVTFKLKDNGELLTKWEEK